MRRNALALAGALWAAIPGLLRAEEDPGMPYVYTKWEQITAKDGLPDTHVFAVKSAGDYVWVGTEDGLARVEKKTKKVRVWREADGLPFNVITAIEVDPKTEDLWLGLFGGGLARFSAGRFDHWHQLNSGLVNDVVYAVCLEGENVWCATTAGASRFNPKSGEWTIFTEKNAPMEEIWNYGCCYGGGKVFLAVWGSGVLEYDVATGAWKDYIDPDGEMEIDLYRDDGVVHVITTGASWADGALWVSTYFGSCRYDGRTWRGFYEHEVGTPSNFTNNVRARSANECYFATDKGLGVCMDFPSETWVTYRSDQKAKRGTAIVKRGAKVIAEIETGVNLPHNFCIYIDVDGNDVWVATSKGVGHGIGEGYYPGLKKPTVVVEAPKPAPAPACEKAARDSPAVAGGANRPSRP